ncbi:MAG: DUF349 domain-containing protein [Acidobacteria bacterium]|nr:DUF349 domain-containing protein [Acidobacteriota bacterium]
MPGVLPQSERPLAVTDSQQSDESVSTPSTPAVAVPKTPAIPTPAAFAARPKSSVAAPSAPAQPSSSVDLVEAAKWGRATDDGHVVLLLNGEEVPVGQYPGASKDDALAYFARKFEDITAQITLLEQRVAANAPSLDMHKTVKHLRATLDERNAVGDVRGAEARLSSLDVAISALEKAERAASDQARAAELEAREALVAEAESIAGQEPADIQWKTSSARMNELFEAWKVAQKSGLRLGRGTEDALWKRFRAARTVFDRHRRAYFSALDSNNAAAKDVKEALIVKAEELANSTDWGQAAGEYRRLMDEWKSAPRANRKEDDALWARFRGAQDKFFAARDEANAVIDAEYGKNLVVKEALLREAQDILPVRDLAAAKKALQAIRERWEGAGKVPRADMARVEAGLRKVEEGVREAEDDNWRRSDPEAKARTSSALTQLEATIAGLRTELAKAEAAGDAKKIKAAREALEAREAWLVQIQKAAEDLR